MKNFKDMSFLKTISIEIGTRCNLSKLHSVCPAQYLKREDKDGMIDSQILEIMDQANKLGFKGYFAFHFYNEPLLYIDRIDKLHRERPNYKLLLWSNGTLIKHVLDCGYDFNIFDKIVFTKYKESDIEMMKYIKSIHADTEIYDAQMDERLSVYQGNVENYYACKKVYIELPIDYKGNVYICTYDWKGEYIIGNLQEQTLDELLYSEKYQLLLNENIGNLRHSSCIELCRHCPRPCLKPLIISNE